MQNNLIARLEPERRDRAVKLAAECRPVTTLAVTELIRDFLQHKTAHGTPIERRLYSGMTTAGSERDRMR